MDICILNSEKTIAINGIKSKHTWGVIDKTDLDSMYGISLESDVRFEFLNKIVIEFDLSEKDRQKVQFALALCEIDRE